MGLTGFFFRLLLLVGVTLSGPIYARVVTTPTSADQRLINPAAAAFRDSFGFAIDASQQTDNETVLGLTKASIEIKTKIEGANTNSVFRTGNFVWELSVSPQRGTKDTASTNITNSGPEHTNTSSSLSLIPVQAIGATKFGTNLSFGLKIMYTGFNFNDDVDLETNTPNTNEKIQQTKKLSGSFLVAAPGVIYQWGTSGFALAYVAEFLRFQNDQSIQGTVDRLAVETSIGVGELTTTDIKSSDAIIARKDVIGLGYSRKFSGSNNFRSEISYEKMPPLTKVQGYPNGEMFRFIAETNFIYFRVGVEATRKTGYYIDPYNLIPYFFKIDHLGTDPVQEYGFFGGLKTSKGHGFGASFSQSTSTGPQKLSVGGSEQEVEKKSTRYGLSYSYFF